MSHFTLSLTCVQMFCRYFIIIDDLWPSSTWHIFNAAFPDGDHGSRILVTTEVDSVAQEWCDHNLKCVFNMEPLNDEASSELFLSRAFGNLSLREPWCLPCASGTRQSFYRV